MTVRKLLWPFVASLSVLCMTSVYAQDAENGASSEESSSSEGTQRPSSGMGFGGYHRLDSLEDGRWIWGFISDMSLANGVTYATPDVSVASTFYAGGVGYVAVSNDSGASWKETLSFSASDNELDADDDENNGNSLTIDQSRLAEIRREYIHQEIVDKFGSEDYADSILDNIADAELVEAQDLSDIEELEVLELDMDSNLNHIPVDRADSSESGVLVSDFDSYIDRYLILTRRGADPEFAVLQAAETNAVWQIKSISVATFAVTSDNVYMTTDRGESWLPLVASDGRSFLSIDVSQDGQCVVIGTTNGLLITRNGGESWDDVTDGLNGGVYEVHVLDNGQRFLAVSTNQIYQSSDGMNWMELPSPLSVNESVLDIVPGNQSRMLVLTTDNLYFVDKGNWDEISYRPFGEETLRQIVSRDPSLSSFVVRTDFHVFEYKDGWLNQNQALFATELGHFSYLKDGISLGMMASSSGLWIAQDLSVIENSPEYTELKNKWEREPSDELVLWQAIESHYLGSDLDKRWGLRSCLAWLLPRVDFEYLFWQQRWDYHKLTKDAKKGVDSTNSWTSKRQTRHEWQIMAHWDFQFDRANRESVAREATLAGLRDDRFALIKRVNSVLKKRHALEMTLLLDLPKLPDNAKQSQVKSLLKKQIKAQLNLQEAESHLNYLTGGYYLPAIHGQKK